MKEKTLKAKNCKCIKCGEQAVAFWPIEPDIKSYPYCRKCLDEIQIKLLLKIYKDENSNNFFRKH
jgi:NAD-dependent SIR2 family protein deacetylase